MNRKYRDKRTERFAEGERIKEFEPFRKQIEKRLEILESAYQRNDLARLPGNRFEALGGDRKGQCSIRINERLRLCFEWPEEATEPYNIEIIDYH